MQGQSSVQTARRKLESALRDGRKQAPRAPSKQKMLAELRDDIVRLRHQQWTWKDISELLKDSIGASPDTIRLAVATGKKKVRKISSGPAKQIAVAQAADTSAAETPKRFGPPEL